jgi:broad specificity phosphatase PhoE
VTLFLLVRHAAHSAVDHTLAGRSQGVALSSEGREQAAGLARHLGSSGIARLQSSPSQRACETAGVLSASLGLATEICPALDEMDFGSWSGRGFGELANDPEWMRWNSERARSRPPGGESMAEAQARIVSHLDQVRGQHACGAVVMVTHAEIIRAAVLHAMSLPLDDWSRIDVQPASVTRLETRSTTPETFALQEVAAV